LNRTTRVLLVEHVDATGAAPEDARARVLALRAAGIAADAIVLAAEERDLQYGSCERAPGHGIAVLPPDATGLRELAAWVRARRPSLVLWASASPGAGPAARVLPRGQAARWWPSGHAPPGAAAGPLRALAGFAPPGDGVAPTPARAGRRLALWDGPFALVAAPPSTTTFETLARGFARAARQHDEADLVVLDDPRPALEEIARACGIGARTHFVGPAPREAEAAWLGTAAALFVPGDAPLSGGLLLRALGAGAAPVAIGAAAAPVADWLDARGCAWARPLDADGAALALSFALGGAEAVRRARERGRAVAAVEVGSSLAARLSAALGAASGASPGRAAA